MELDAGRQGLMDPIGRFGRLKPMAQFARLSPATILIVESEALVRLELAGRLEDADLMVLTASNADAAIILLDSHPEIELMVTDIRMSGDMDGLRLAHHVRDRWPPVKIIVTSGMGDIGSTDLPRGSLFLRKPFSPASLSLALARMMADGAPAFQAS
jgi:DNA-binding NtrC family response regulator